MVTAEADAEDRELQEAKTLLANRFGSVEAAWKELVQAQSLEALAEEGEDAGGLRAAFVRIGPPEPLPDPAPLVHFVQTAGRYWLEAALVVWLLSLGVGGLLLRSPDSSAAPPAAVNLDELGEGPLSPAEIEAVAAELRSLLGSNDTASFRLRVGRLVDSALPPLLRELNLPRHVADRALGRPPAEDSAAAAFLTRWIQRERSRGTGHPGGAGTRTVLRFEAASADLPPAAFQAAAEFMREPDRLLVLVGSADRSGEADRVPELALRRARAVAEILIARSTPVGEVVVLARPAIAGPVPTAAGTAEPENRRVEVWVR